MEYYEQVASNELADDFYAELVGFIRDAAERPDSFGIREGDLRRVNLHRFPYHFLFRVVDDSMRILVVRHHNRHPSLGTRRR
jgi:plasmid stabilization system protein ParE